MCILKVTVRGKAPRCDSGTLYRLVVVIFVDDDIGERREEFFRSARARRNTAKCACNMCVSPHLYRDTRRRIYPRGFPFVQDQVVVRLVSGQSRIFHLILSGGVGYDNTFLDLTNIRRIDTRVLSRIS